MGLDTMDQVGGHDIGVLVAEGVGEGVTVEVGVRDGVLEGGTGVEVGDGVKQPVV